MRTRNPAISGSERTAVGQDLAELYDAGFSIRQLAERTGRSYGAVHQLLLDAGVKLRPRGGPRIRAN